MKLSIVTTLYNSEHFINEFYERITKEAKKFTDDYELIFVSDGSPDNALHKAVELHEKDIHVNVVNLSRNYGHHQAIMSGLEQAEGELVFLIDSDLEEEPEILKDFLEELLSDDSVDVVYGVQKSRKGKWFERASGNVFWKIFNILSHIKISENPLTVRLMKKQYVDSLIQFKEKELFLAGVFKLVGFNQKSLEIVKLSSDMSNYSLIKKLQLLNNAIISFSAYPLLISFYVGLLISTFSFFYGIILIINKLMFNSITSGWTSMMVSIWFLSGVLLLSIGIIGMYLSKIYSEIKNRPVITKRVYKGDYSE